MQVYHLFFVILAVTTVAGEYDEDFCKKRIGPVDDGTATGGPKPVFHDNFYTFMEVKVNLTKTVIYSDNYYSQQAEMVYATIRDEKNQTQFWVDAHTDEIMTGPMQSGQMCVDSPLEGSDFAMLIGATVDATGNVELATPEVALGWDKKHQVTVKYMGPGQIRGIRTVTWRICSYLEQQNVTVYAEWHIVDPTDVLLPLVNYKDSDKPVLPVFVNVEGINKTDPKNITQFGYSMDFTFFSNIQSTDPIFQIPPAQLCQAKPSAQVPLPTAPAYFRFKGEQITILNPTAAGATPGDLLYTVEQYEHELQLFVQDIITTPDNPVSGNDKSYARTVHDYNTGLSFIMDLVNGQCIVSAIMTGVDTINVAGGNVQMRNSQQFFDLDSNQYQYMGVHKMRGMDCDTWSAYFVAGESIHDQNTLYTWYFASPKWLKANGYYNYTTPMPVTLEMTKADRYIQFNFYEFDTLDGFTIPDMSQCFDPTATHNIEFFISAAYDKVVAPSIEDFSRSVLAAVMEQTHLSSFLRISELDVQPASRDETLVRFKLLDLSTVQVKGDVPTPQPVAPNSQIYSDLERAINAGTFSLDVPIDSAVGGTGKLTVYAKSSSLGLFSDGKFVAYNSGSSFSSGSMAGIGIGMLIVGLVLGALAIFGFRKFKSGGGGTNIDMKRIGHESES